MKKLFLVLLAWFAAINLAFAAIDINSASEAELDKLPGIGPAKAKAIVEDRQKNGPFKSVDDLKRVKGIGDKTFDKLKPEITVSGGARSEARPAAKKEAKVEEKAANTDDKKAKVEEKAAKADDKKAKADDKKAKAEEKKAKAEEKKAKADKKKADKKADAKEEKK